MCFNPEASTWNDMCHSSRIYIIFRAVDEIRNLNDIQWPNILRLHI